MTPTKTKKFPENLAEHSGLSDAQLDTLEGRIDSCVTFREGGDMLLVLASVPFSFLGKDEWLCALLLTPTLTHKQLRELRRLFEKYCALDSRNIYAEIDPNSYSALRFARFFGFRLFGAQLNGRLIYRRTT